jgi:hypothetical protein
MYRVRLHHGDLQYHCTAGSYSYGCGYTDLFLHQCDAHGWFLHFGSYFYLDRAERVHGYGCYAYGYGCGYLYRDSH